MLIQHGIPKLQKYDTIKEHFPDPLGVGSELSLILTLLAAVLCAGFLVLGVATRAAVLPLAFAMAMAFFVIHADDPMQKKELALVYLAAYAALFFLGGGNFSINRFVSNRLKGNRFISWFLS